MKNNPSRASDYIDPVLRPIAIDDLRPTQITVGMREVEAKRRHWKARAAEKKQTYVQEHMVPVILGPKKSYYILDHHHLVRALQEEKVENIFVYVVADLSMLDRDAFWYVLDNRNWMHPFDQNGKRRDYDAVPDRVSGLVDDPFRSLAGSLRRAGGFAKDETPYTEFLWADFLRRRIARKLVEGDFEQALDEALQLAKSRQADYLPGWAGTDPE
jgi:hypothetical protein